MEVIGEKLKTSREEKGLSLEEVAGDLKITVKELQNIESGNRKAFADVYMLREYIHEYAKYLGLDYEEMVGEFNEYMFEYTSKIPVDAIERISKQKEAEEIAKGPLSPYTISKKKVNKKLLIAIIVIILLFVSIMTGIAISKSRHSNNTAISMLM